MIMIFPSIVEVVYVLNESFVISHAIRIFNKLLFPSLSVVE